MVDQKIRVLLVEDNESDIKQISRLLRQVPNRPLKLNSAKRLQEALQKIHGFKYDVILLDLGLPDSRGIDTLEEVHSACPQIPIIVYTITGAESLGIEAINRGAQDYLVKGTTDERILAKAIRYAIERKRLESAEQHNHELLKENEERLSLLVKASSDVLYQMSPDWREMRQLSGGHFIANASEPDRTWLDSYIPSDEQKRVMAAINRAIETRSVFELEHRVMRADGTVGWTFSRAVPRLNTKGEIIEWFGAASDITVRKKAEEALRESNERLSFELKVMTALKRLSTLPIRGEDLYPLLLEILDAAIEFTSAQMGSLQLMNRDTHDLTIAVQRGFEDWYVDYWNNVQKGQGCCGTALAQGKRMIVEDVEKSDLFNSQSLEIQLNAGIRSVQSTPLVSRRGKIIGIISTHYKQIHRPTDREKQIVDLLAYEAADIIEQVQNERMLRESEERFSAAFRNSPDALIISEVETGKIVDVNDNWVNLWGFNREESVGKRSTDLGIFVHREDREKALQILRKEGHLSDFIVDIRTKSGFSRQALLSTVKLSKGLMLTIMRDITERNNLEEQLKIRVKELASLNEDLETFSYSVAHDLRNPLRVIKGFIDFLLEDCADQLSKECREYIDSIKNGTIRMNSIIDDMLALSKISRQEMVLTEIDMSEMARLAIKELQSAQPGRSVEVKVQDGLRAKGDARLISVALGNLLGNAWKYTSKVDHPVIEFGAIEKDEKTVYYVSDNGAGFDMSKADTLFTPFQRLHSEQDFKGTGVGLALVDKAIKRHNGNVWAEGEVGKGATFLFTLNITESPQN